MADQEQGLTTADIAAGGETDDHDSGIEMQEDVERDGAGPLLPTDEAGRYDEQWKSVQGSFVDHPRQAVEEADKLVADLMQRLATEFSETRAGLERQWESSDDVATEDLRVAMTRYRSFFERLLAT
jgi:hypothetical protein